MLLDASIAVDVQRDEASMQLAVCVFSWLALAHHVAKFVEVEAIATRLGLVLHRVRDHPSTRRRTWRAAEARQRRPSRIGRREVPLAVGGRRSRDALSADLATPCDSIETYDGGVLESESTDS